MKRNKHEILTPKISNSFAISVQPAFHPETFWFTLVHFRGEGGNVINKKKLRFLLLPGTANAVHFGIIRVHEIKANTM